MNRDNAPRQLHPLDTHLSRRVFLMISAGAAGSVLLHRQVGAAAPATAPSVAPAAQQQGGSLLAAIYTEPPTVADSMFTSSALVENISRLIFEGLFAPDSTYHPQPMLVESYTVSPDGSHYEFTLREGLKFHNGQAVTAADVVASLARWTQLSNKGKILGPRLAEDGLQAVDDRTVTVTFQGPTGVFLDFLAMPNSFIMPATAAEAAGMEQLPEDQIIGTGPFRFEEHAVDRFTRLVRNEEYQSRSEPPDGLAGERIVYLDDVQLIPVPDASVRASGILTGEYHFAEELEPDQYDMLESDPGVVALIRKPGSAMLAHFNKARGPFTDPRVRQAVALAINKEEAMISGFGREEFFRLDPSVAAPETPWHSSVGEEQFLQYDPEAAKALLAEAGYDGTPIRWLTTREYPYLYTSAEYMKQSLEAIGMPVELVVSDWATLLQNRGNPDLWEIFVTTESTMLHPVTRPWLDKAWPGFWDSAAKDELVTRLLETDPSEYQQVLDDWAALIYEEVPFVKLGEFFGLRAHRAEVQGFVNTPEWLFWNVSLG